MSDDAVPAFDGDEVDVHHLIEEINDLCGRMETAVGGGDADDVASLVAAVDDLAPGARAARRTPADPRRAVSVESPPGDRAEETAPPRSPTAAPADPASRDEVAGSVGAADRSPSPDGPVASDDEPTDATSTSGVELGGVIVPVEGVLGTEPQDPEATRVRDGGASPVHGPDDPPAGEPSAPAPESIDTGPSGEAAVPDPRTNRAGPPPPPDASAGVGPNVDAGSSEEEDAEPATDEPPPAVGEAAPEDEPPRAEDGALKTVDMALAGDVEELLQGSFESVAAVLDDEFDEPGHRVSVEPASAPAADALAPVAEAPAAGAQDHDDDSPPEEGRFRTIEELVQDDVGGPAPAGSETAPRPAAFEPVQSDPPPTAEFRPAEVSELDDGGITQLLPARRPSAEPSVPLPAATSTAVVTTVAAAERSSEAAVEPPNLEPPAEPPAELPEAAAEATPEGGSRQVEPTAPFEPPPEPEPLPHPLAGLRSAIEPPLKMLLRMINLPLRLVPPSARPIVDWLALSLVFWVPIVWVLLLFVF